MPPASPAAPTLSDGTVTLRALSADDIPAIVEQSTDAETVRWTTLWEGYTHDDGREFVERTEREWASGERHTWAVEHDGRFAGLVGYRPRGEQAVEVSFAAHPGSPRSVASSRVPCGWRSRMRSTRAPRSPSGTRSPATTAPARWPGDSGSASPAR